MEKNKQNKNYMKTINITGVNGYQIDFEESNFVQEFREYIFLAMNKYAVMIRDGDGIEINKIKAAKYFKIAGDNRNTEAKVNYGIILLIGDGIEINTSEAVKYLIKKVSLNIN